MLEKAAAIKRFKYYSLWKDLKKQTSLPEKQYQGLNKVFKSDEKKEPVTIKKQ